MDCGGAADAAFAQNGGFVNVFTSDLDVQNILHVHSSSLRWP